MIKSHKLYSNIKKKFYELTKKEKKKSEKSEKSGKAENSFWKKNKEKYGKNY